MSDKVSKSTSKVVIGASRSSEPESLSAQLAGAGSDNLMQVQDLLFGARFREMERRFDELEDQLYEMEQQHADALKRARSELETRLRAEREAAETQLKERRRTTDDALSALTREQEKQARDMLELGKKQDKRHAALEDDLARAQRIATELMNTRADNLTDELSRSVSQLSGALDQAVQRLQDQKPDKAVLSEWMMDMALRLGRETEASRPRSASRPQITAGKPDTSTKTGKSSASSSSSRGVSARSGASASPRSSAGGFRVDAKRPSDS